MVFIFCLCFFLTAACAHQPPVAAIDRQIAALSCDAVFAENGRTKKSANLLNVDDAKQLLADGRWQEAAWLLRQIGEYERAEALEAQMIANMTAMPANGELLNTSTAAEVYLVTLENGQRAIFKPFARYWKIKGRGAGAISNPFAEVMAYKFAQVMGLTVVPVTVMRTLNGMEGSLQAFVSSPPRDTSDMFNPKLRKQMYDNVEVPLGIQTKMIFLFDYLIFNTDRHSGNLDLNWMLGAKLDPRQRPGVGSGKVAYDNGAAFQHQAAAEGKFPPQAPTTSNSQVKTFIDPQKIAQYKDFFEALKNKLTDDKIRELMSGTFDETAIREAIQRRRTLVEFYERYSH